MAPKRSCGQHDYIVTPFPERLGKFCWSNPYWLWVLVGIVFLVLRLPTMILAGEPVGYYPINIVYCILPSILASQIILYSKDIEDLTPVFCDIIDSDSCVESWSEDRIRQAFKDRHMYMWGLGMIILVVFVFNIAERQPFPSPANKMRHIEKVISRTAVNVGEFKGTLGGKDVRFSAGWIQLPLGQAANLDRQSRAGGLFKLLLDGNNSHKLNGIDLSTSTDECGTIHHQAIAQEHTFSVPGPLSSLVRGMDCNMRWGLSQLTYLVVMIPLLFMSGAFLRCQKGIIMLIWRLTQEDRVKVHIYPHPLNSIKAVGRCMGIIAIHCGIIYTVVMLGIMVARPDKVSLAIACFFSLTVVGFFIIPQYYLHRLMLQMKYDKISPLDELLEKALNDVSDDFTVEKADKAKAILELQQALSVASEWPFNMNLLISIVSSILIPIFIAALTLVEQF